MSLTRLLRECPAVAERLTNLVPYNARCVVSGINFPRAEMDILALSRLLARERREPYQIPILAPSLNDHYALVGTAFDYMLRVQLYKLFAGKSTAPRPSFVEGSIAETAVTMLRAQPEVGAETKAIYERTLEVARTVIDQYRPCDRQVRPVASACLKLARIDGYFRNGVTDPEVELVDSYDEADLCHLFEVVPWDDLWSPTKSGDLRLNPSYGKISELFNGADSDLVSQGALIDFKCTRHLDIIKHFPQLVGYAMIIDAFRETDSLFPAVDRAGIYFARHGLLASVDLAGVYGNPDYQGAKNGLWQVAKDRHVEGAAFA